MIEKEDEDFNLYELILENRKNGEKKFSNPFYRSDEKWVQEYIKQFGEEPSFF